MKIKNGVLEQARTKSACQIQTIQAPIPLRANPTIEIYSNSLCFTFYSWHKAPS